MSENPTLSLEEQIVALQPQIKDAAEARKKGDISFPFSA